MGATSTATHRTTWAAGSVEEYALARMGAGLLRVDLDTLEVWGYHTQRRTWKLVKPRYNRGRAKLPLGPSRSYVYRNRLVWMWVHRRVPDGVVDHVDGDKTNDAPGNLRLQSREESDRQGAARQNLRGLLDWFDFMGRV